MPYFHVHADQCCHLFFVWLRNGKLQQRPWKGTSLKPRSLDFFEIFGEKNHVVTSFCGAQQIQDLKDDLIEICQVKNLILHLFPRTVWLKLSSLSQEHLWRTQVQTNTTLEEIESQQGVYQALIPCDAIGWDVNLSLLKMSRLKRPMPFGPNSLLGRTQVFRTLERLWILRKPLSFLCEAWI